MKRLLRMVVGMAMILSAVCLVSNHEQTVMGVTIGGTLVCIALIDYFLELFSE